MQRSLPMARRTAWGSAHPHGTMKRGSVHIMPMEPMSMRGAWLGLGLGLGLRVRVRVRLRLRLRVRFRSKAYAKGKGEG